MRQSGLLACKTALKTWGGGPGHSRRHAPGTLGVGFGGHAIREVGLRKHSLARFTCGRGVLGHILQQRPPLGAELGVDIQRL